MVASNVFAKSNTNKTIDELIAAIPTRIALYKQHGIKTRAVGVQRHTADSYAPLTQPTKSEVDHSEGAGS